MNILCTNDDGYLANGIRVLASAASTLGSVTVVAPDREQSATSNSLTLHHPLRARLTSDNSYVVDGTPTDCVILAVNGLLPGQPDVCLSGVNHGPNMGEDVLYSGTVAAAMEATVIGIPAIAISYVRDQPEELEGWESVVRVILREILGREEFPEVEMSSRRRRQDSHECSVKAEKWGKHPACRRFAASSQAGSLRH